MKLTSPKPSHFLAALPLLFGAAPAASFADAGTYTIPIYVQGNHVPSNYLIYASQNGGAAVPYLFDTGSPNMFTVQGVNTGIAPTGSFPFGDGTPVYGYYLDSKTISLTDQAGTPIATTAGAVPIANVVAIDGQTISQSTVINGLNDNTFGDFGAGMYGNSTLGTILTGLSLGTGIKTGWIVDVAGIDTGVGSLTIGLSQARIDALNNAPGAIRMTMNGTGDVLVTPTGTVSAYAKEAVTGDLTLGNGSGNSLSRSIGVVFDTGGGPNAMVYDPAFLGLGGGWLNLAYDAQTFLQIDGSTPWGGDIKVVDNTTGGRRVNSGGFLFETYTVMFNLADGELTLVPFGIPEPASLALWAAGAGAFAVRRRKVAER